MGTDLERFLLAFKDDEIFFAPNPGNAGDSVIACAECQMFERLGLNYKIIDLNVDPVETAGKIIFYGGGGNLVGHYPNARNFILRHHQRAKRLVVLPHTVRSYPELLESLGGNVDIICREQGSFDYVSKCIGLARVHLMSDVAFSLDTVNVLSNSGLFASPWFRRPLRTAKRSVRVLLHTLRNVRQRKILSAFRTDVEGTGRTIAPINFDVSQALAADNMSHFDSALAAHSVIKFIDRFDIVHTDRLHVCIVSLLLNKEVYFFDNSYGKNSAVYEYSMRGRYPKLRWHGQDII